MLDLKKNKKTRGAGDIVLCVCREVLFNISDYLAVFSLSFYLSLFGDKAGIGDLRVEMQDSTI